MKTDQELLELAAKAAGMVVLERPWNADDGWFFCLNHGDPAMHFRFAANPHAHVAPWMPITDDGDAFRLASIMNQTVEFGNNMVMYPVEVGGEGTDPLKATRRAIVLAAAKVGELMP